ncbi:glycosyltransferase [Pedobacter sp. PLR]|uniref:glycosyltransferase n=1 Tax=Pedobacter sp. PLR TaxID=2994465 RepID=UPI002245835C|nr:glycosyltransferase [Pedobacter sp. PLR]MCX2449930.1 glycosyltransferase [Pedobacter sp. PLR]
MEKKLFFVINNLQGGGAERVISILANEFSKQGYNVFMVCLNEAEPAFKISPEIRRVNLLKGRGTEHIWNRIRYAGLIYFRLIALLIKERPYCVVSFMTAANLWTGLTCSLTNVPFVVSERTMPDRTINSFNYFFRKLSFLIYRKSKAIVVPAIGIADCIKRNESYKELNNFKIIRNPIHVFPKPSNTSVNDKTFILGVGRLNFIKGFDLLIDAYSKINAENVDLIIVGNGNEFEKLNAQIEKLNLVGRVKLLGVKDNLQDYYHQAELFVLSSRNEGYPNALIEAMSFGCACIAVDCEYGPSEIIDHEVNGLLVENFNQIQLTEAMNELITNQSLRKKIAGNAQLIKKTNSVKSISANWGRLILNQG